MEITEKTREKYTAAQILYIDFLGSGQINEDGKRISKEEFAKIVQVNPDTLYTWQKINGFWSDVVAATERLMLKRYPKWIRAMEVQILKGNVNAFNALTNQASIKKADKTDNKNENIGELTIKFDNA